MSARRPIALYLYRRTADPRPAASVDAAILAAARGAARTSGRAPLFVAGMAATVVLGFTSRCLLDDPPRPDTREYGLTAGQTHDYLLTFDPLITGPGSQEGQP